jgi:hypothetical protein
MECLEMCFMEIVASVHFVYDWHLNKKCWNINEVKTLIMDNSNIKLLGCLNILKDVQSQRLTVCCHSAGLSTKKENEVGFGINVYNN